MTEFAHHGTGRGAADCGTLLGFMIPDWERVTCQDCLQIHVDNLRGPRSAITRGTADQERAAVDSAERIGEAVVRIADAVRLVLPIITGAVVDIRKEIRR